MRKSGSSTSTAAALLVLGVVIGTGLIFGTLYASGSMSQRVTTSTVFEPVTTTQILTATQILTTTVTPSYGVTVSSVQVSAQVTKCTAGAGTAANNNQCTVTLTNTGTSNVAITGGSEQIGGVAVACNEAPAGTIPASGSLSVTCLQAVATAAQTVGSQAVGQFNLSNGASVTFSGVWS
jgi:hypothetical protein